MILLFIALPNVSGYKTNFYFILLQRLTDNEIEIALHLTTSEDAWVGIGFSSDQNMGDDDIFYCQKRGAEIGVVSAFSTGMSRPVDIDGSDHVTNIGTSSDANDFKCSFRRPLSVTKVSSSLEVSFFSFFIFKSSCQTIFSG